jgi:hypothetical protein
MRPFRIPPLATAGLLLLSASAALSLLWLARAATQDIAPRIAVAEWSPGSRGDAVQGLPQPKNKAAYSETLARPILFEDRRPFVPPPPPPPPPPQPVVVAAPPPQILNPGLALAGVAIVDGIRQAYVTSPANRDGAWVREGEAVMGWQIAQVTSESVTIRNGGQSIELLLYGDEARK